MPNLVGRFPVQDLHGGVVDLVDDGLQVRVRQVVRSSWVGNGGCARCGSRSTFSHPLILLGVYPLLSASMTRESGGGYAMRVGLRGRQARCSAFLRAGHGRMERPRCPRVRLRAARPAGTIRVVLVGRGPQAAFQLATDGRLVTADPWSYLTHAKPLPVPQFVDPDTFLCQHVGIRFHIERDTFSGHET